MNENLSTTLDNILKGQKGYVVQKIKTMVPSCPSGVSNHLWVEGRKDYEQPLSVVPLEYLFRLVARVDRDKALTANLSDHFFPNIRPPLSYPTCALDW